jgi:hypothetical protein
MKVLPRWRQRDVIRERDDDRDERRWFVDETRDLRAQLSAAWDAEQMVSALAWLPSHLARIWRMPLPAIERRRILFAIWDEAAEADDRERGWAGAEARGIVDTFVRMNLPAGSANGYSAGELERLNRVRSAASRFSPYDGPRRRALPQDHDRT